MHAYRLNVCSCAIEYSVFISHGIWLLRTRAIRRRAKEAQLSFDDFPEAIEWQESGFRFHRAFDWARISERVRRRKPTPDLEQEVTGV